MSVQQRWDYYSEIARITGRDQNNEKLGYSLEDYFFDISVDEDGKEVITPLTAADQSTLAQAFLGVENAGAAVKRALRDGKPEMNADKRAMMEQIFHRWDEESKQGIITRSPNDEQKQAIRNALIYPVSFVQGPPGTGKTEMILNLLTMIHILFGGRKTVAVVSSNNEALQNVYQKIEESRDEDYRMAMLYDRYSVLGSKKNRKDWKKELNKRKKALEEALKNNDIDDKERQSLQTKRDILKREIGNIYIRRLDNYVYPDYLRTRPIFSSTVHSLHKTFNGTYMNENPFDGQFDYVIMDESSQSKIILGLAALTRAKNIVLVGDDNQLAPIIEKSIQKLNKDKDQENTNVDSDYKEEAEKSVLGAFSKVFRLEDQEEPLRTSMLKDHYRCHPSIISFCNDYVYDNKLRIKSRDDNKFHMRAIWYEGDYCEILYPEAGAEKTEGGSAAGREPVFEIEDIEQKTDENENDEQAAVQEDRPRQKPAKYNMKQIEILIGELRTRLENKEFEGKNVVVLTPYRKERDLLEERIKKEFPELFPKNKKNAPDDGNEPDEEAAPAVDALNELTVHSAQGKERQIVYFLTVVDYYSRNDSEWCQRMRLINVAVSRAREEFCVIASSRWMPKDVQKELTGYALYQGYNVRSDKDENGEDKNKNEMFYCKLFEYICREENRKKWQEDPHFGLHKSGLVSVFDKIPRLREENRASKWNGKIQESSGEQCVHEMLTELVDELNKKESGQEYEVLREVPLSRLRNDSADPGKCGDEKLLDYVNDSFTRLDLVVCRGNSVRLIIEVDGSYHRGADEDPEERRKVKERDNKKNKWICDILGGDKIFLRMPADGTFIQTWQECQDKDGLKEYKFKEIPRSKKVRDEDGDEKTILLDEKAVIGSLLSENTETPIYISDENIRACRRRAEYAAMKNDVLKKLNGVVADSYNSLRGFADPQNISDDALAMIKGLNYINAGEVRYEDDQQHNFYLCRYANAYAFDYALMYDIVMRSMMRSGCRTMDAVSFGCGSMVDALAMAYARANLAAADPAYADIKMTYKGLDAANWGKFFVPPKADEFYIRGDRDKDAKAPVLSPLDEKIRSNFDSIRHHKLDLVNEFGEEGADTDIYMGNVFIFPRILNELYDKSLYDYGSNQPILKFVMKFAEALISSMLKGKYDEYYICVSHSISGRGLYKYISQLLLKVYSRCDTDLLIGDCNDIYEMMGMKDKDGNAADKGALKEFTNMWTGADKLTDTNSFRTGSEEEDKYKIHRYATSEKCYAFKSMADNYETVERNKERKRLGQETAAPPRVTHISEINGDFESTVDGLAEYLKSLEKAAGNAHTVQVSTVSGTLFQIIKLTRSEL